MRLEEAVELLPDEGGPDLLVMELATGGERDDRRDRERQRDRARPSEDARGDARRPRDVLRHARRPAADARSANLIVEELGIEHFFNIQLVGDYVIEINPRISTIVYQEDLNLPYLGVKRALGEISDDELRTLRDPHPPRPNGAALLRPARIRHVTHLRTRLRERCPVARPR